MKNVGGIAALFFASGAVITFDEIGHADLTPARYYGLVAGFLLIGLVGSFQGDFALALAWLFFLAILVSRGTRVFSKVADQAGKGGKV